MTCEDAMALGQRRVCDSTTAEQAAVLSHALSCKECMGRAAKRFEELTKGMSPGERLIYDLKSKAMADGIKDDSEAYEMVKKSYAEGVGKGMVTCMICGMPALESMVGDALKEASKKSGVPMEELSYTCPECSFMLHKLEAIGIELPMREIK